MSNNCYVTSQISKEQLFRTEIGYLLCNVIKTYGIACYFFYLIWALIVQPLLKIKGINKMSLGILILAVQIKHINIYV